MADILTKVQWGLDLFATVTEDLGVDGQTNTSRILRVPGMSGEIFAPGTDIPISDFWLDLRTLAGTSENLDLTALPYGNFSTAKNFTGKKVQFWAFKSTSTNNAAGMTIAPLVTTGYNIFGGTSAQVAVFPFPGEAYMFVGNDKPADVGASTKHIRIGGTAADSYYFMMIAG